MSKKPETVAAKAKRLRREFENADFGCSGHEKWECEEACMKRALSRLIRAERAAEREKALREYGVDPSRCASCGGDGVYITDGGFEKTCGCVARKKQRAAALKELRRVAGPYLP